MKILNIYFKNINSLEGESRIHFDQPPIADGGVFAITGPNGSGKSSILDVITLGLYGETYRFDKPAAHVMTKAAADSFAHVEFSLGEDKFRSSWDVRRENGSSEGALLPSDMKLVQLNGSEKVLEEGSPKVRSRMAELTGMDFHKFSKSMVLAQGDFAAFLNALDSERMDILEKISSKDIYTEYKQQIEEKNSQNQTLLQELEQDLSAIPVMDKSTITAREHDLEDFKQQAIELESEQKEFQQQLLWLEDVADLEDQVEALDNQQQQIESQLQDYQQKIEKIDGSQESIAFEQALIQIDSQSGDVKESRKTLDAFRGELKLLQKQLHSSGFNEKTPAPTQTLAEQKSSFDQVKLKQSELKSELPQEQTLFQSLNQQLDENQSILTTTETWLQEHEMDKTLLENFPQTEKLREIRAELAELSEKQKANIKRGKQTAETLKDNVSNIKSLSNKSNNLKNQIAADEETISDISEGYALQELQELVVEQQERVGNFQELFDLANVNTKLGKKGVFAKLFSSKNENKEEKQLADDATQLQLKIGKEQNIVQTLERAVFNEMLLQKMQPDREHLQEDKACPLCGALNHPYLEHPPAISNSKQVLKDQQKKVKQLKADAGSLSKKIVMVKKQAEIDGKKEDQLQIIYSQWSSLANKLNVANMDLDIDNLSLMKDLLKKEKEELSHLTRLINKFIKLEGSISQARSSIEANQVTLDRVTIEKEQLDIKNNNGPSAELDDLQQALTQLQAQEQVLAAKVLEQLTSIGEELPAKKSKQDALIKKLKGREQDYQAHKMQHKALIEERQGLESKVSSSQSKIDQITVDIEQQITQVEEQELVGLHLSLTEKQKLIADKEIIFSQQETELQNLKQQLQEQSKDVVGGDLLVLRDQIALYKEKPEIEMKHLELAQKIGKVKSSLEQSQKQLELEQVKNKTTKSEEELTILQKTNKEQLDIVQLEKVSLENRLDKQNELFEKYEQISAKVESQKIIAEASAGECKVIDDENGLEFRRKVQQLNTDKLLSHSNQILEKLSGRYYVRTTDSDNGLAIEIEDTKQNNVRRLPKTLSGGESFIVSLALALGLAEMAKNGHAVDSLFLDEGFGNLDAESLYLAMTTLENLKTNGKIVGVISHVEGVQKRIKTQIEMIKKPNGLSALKIVS